MTDDDGLAIDRDAIVSPALAVLHDEATKQRALQRIECNKVAYLKHISRWPAPKVLVERNDGDA